MKQYVALQTDCRQRFSQR